jgi:hypothetical protein
VPWHRKVNAREQADHANDQQHDHGDQLAHDRQDGGDDVGDHHDDHKRCSIAQKTGCDEGATGRRLRFAQAEQEMLTCHQNEKLALDAAQKAESGGLLFRIRAKVAELIEQRERAWLDAI